jgi:hypothetical protein
MVWTEFHFDVCFVIYRFFKVSITLDDDDIISFDFFTCMQLPTLRAAAYFLGVLSFSDDTWKLSSATLCKIVCPNLYVGFMLRARH